MTVCVFVSFDLDHDNDLKVRLCDQAADIRSKIDVLDWSIREVAADWKLKLHKRISNSDVVVVICGGYTDRSANVAAELEVARETQRPYFLLDGRPGTARKPAGALEVDQLLEWKTETLYRLSGMNAPAAIPTSLDDLRPTASRSRLRRLRR